MGNPENKNEKTKWEAPKIMRLKIQDTKSLSAFNFTENGQWYGFLGTPAGS